jgi:hypothetical protein
VKASTKKTPWPSPALHSAVQEAQGQGGQQYVGTPGRLRTLRQDCLIRDRHRCMISLRFDIGEAKKRWKEGNPQDDDGALLQDNQFAFAHLEVAHIIPHSITKANRDTKLVYLSLSSIKLLPYCFCRQSHKLTLPRTLPDNLPLLSLTCSMLMLRA